MLKSMMSRLRMQNSVHLGLPATLTQFQVLARQEYQLKLQLPEYLESAPQAFPLKLPAVQELASPEFQLQQLVVPESAYQVYQSQPLESQESEFRADQS